MKILLGKKLGMTQLFLDSGEMVAVNVVCCEPLVVLRQKSLEKDGYATLVVGYQKTDRKKKKPITGQFKSQGTFDYIREVPLPDSGKAYKTGDTLDISLFEAVKKVDVQGISKGKGFAGNIKRHHFSRGPMTHGHDHHRAPGAISSGTTPGRVRKNKRMAGRMGNETVSVVGQKLVKLDKENNLLFIQGSVPGGKDSLVLIKESARK